MWPLGVKLLKEGVEAGLLLQDIRAGRAGGFFLQGQVHAFMAAIRCGWPGLMRSMAMPRLSHQTDSLERLYRALGLAKGTPLSERMATGKPRSLNSWTKALDDGGFPGRCKGFAGEQIARTPGRSPARGNSSGRRQA